MASLGDRFGAHRVVEPKGSLPQAAWKVDNDFSRVFSNEIVIDVTTLNLDAASFRQIEEATDGSDAAIAAVVKETVAERGKQHNPVTGSGGMLLGTVRAVGEAIAGRHGVVVGDRVATLVSLSLTPLRVDEINGIHRAAAQLEVSGQAVLFESGICAKLPADMPERLALAALDVAGAAPQVARICKPGESVLIVGAGGKSGVLCAYAARKAVGPAGRVVGVEAFEAAAKELRALGLCDEVVVGDARDGLFVREASLRANGGRDFDRGISCVNVEGAEMGVILATRDRGSIYFFAMNTSFTRAALGAEGVGKDVDMLIGNGYAQDHAEVTLAILREAPQLRALFEARYAR